MAYDVIVIGGGAMGAASALALAHRGTSVVLLERFEPGHDRGSSHGPARIFRVAYAEPEYVRLALHARMLWRELERECDVGLLTTIGGVDHGPRTAVREVADALEAVGVACERVSPAEAQQRWPGLRFDESVIFQPDAARIDADETVGALHAAAAARGVELGYRERVLDLRATASAVEVATDRRVLTGQVAVVSAGSWTPQLITGQPFAAELPPLRVSQEQPAYFAAQSDDDWPAFIHHVDVPVYGLPTGLGTLKIGAHGNGPLVDPDDRPSPDPQLLRELEEYVATWVPGVRPDATGVDSCLYTSTPDSRFVLRRFGPIVVCSACSGHGFKFVPAVAERVTELALES